MQSIVLSPQRIGVGLVLEFQFPFMTSGGDESADDALAAARLELARLRDVMARQEVANKNIRTLVVMMLKICDGGFR